MVAFELDNAAFGLFYKNNPLQPDTDEVIPTKTGASHASTDDGYDPADTRDFLPEAASFFGDWWGLMVACALVVALLVWRRPKRWRYYVRVVVAMMITSTLAGALTNGIRLVSCRARPTSQVQPGFYPLYNGKERAILRHAYSSFPSGHAATAAGLFTLVLLLNWRLGLLMSLVPIIVAWSRLYFGVHHLSDVTASVVVAFFMAAWVWTYFMPWLRVKYTLQWCKRKLLSGVPA
jgi:membrane-associated phospholipid phosphatase